MSGERPRPSGPHAPCHSIAGIGGPPPSARRFRPSPEHFRFTSGSLPVRRLRTDERHNQARHGGSCWPISDAGQRGAWEVSEERWLGGTEGHEWGGRTSDDGGHSQGRSRVPDTRPRPDAANVAKIVNPCRRSGHVSQERRRPCLHYHI